MPLVKQWDVSKPRFEAEWVHKQTRDADGEWDPDCDENHLSYHAAKEEAERAAIRRSKAAPAGVEWIRVAETRYENGEWITVRAWTGDWDNGILWSEPVYSLTAEEL
jgi:hypothetical protein